MGKSYETHTPRHTHTMYTNSREYDVAIKDVGYIISIRKGIIWEVYTTGIKNIQLWTHMRKRTWENEDSFVRETVITWEIFFVAIDFFCSTLICEITKGDKTTKINQTKIKSRDHSALFLGRISQTPTVLFNLSQEREIGCVLSLRNEVTS